MKVPWLSCWVLSRAAGSWEDQSGLSYANLGWFPVTQSEINDTDESCVLSVWCFPTGKSGVIALRSLGLCCTRWNWGKMKGLGFSWRSAFGGCGFLSRRAVWWSQAAQQSSPIPTAGFQIQAENKASGQRFRPRPLHRWGEMCLQ